MPVNSHEESRRRQWRARGGRQGGLALVALLFFGSPLHAQMAGQARASFSGSIREIPAATQTAPSDRHRATITRTVLSQAETIATMDFEVTLKMRNFPELQDRVGRGELVSPGEMAAKYYPLEADYEAVAAWITDQGLTVTLRDPNRLAIFGRGTVSQVRQAFQVTFARVAFENEEYTSAVTAPSVPATLVPALVGINGLQPHLRPHKHARRLPAVQPNSTTANAPPYLPSQIAKAYNANGLGVTGAGQKIGIVIDTFPSNSDLTSFWTTCNISQSLSNMEFVQVVSGTLPAPSGEETLDVEWSSSMAPGVKVRVYATFDLSFVHLDQAYQKILTDLPTQPGLRQVSLSFGAGETYISTGQMQTDAQYFASLAGAGVTVFVSSGDGGSSPGTSGGEDHSGPVQVETPANMVSVTSVGGTSLYVDASTGNYSSETTWYGSGGGSSVVFSRPSWQTGTGVPSGTTRLVPDVACAADPNTGCFVVLNGTTYQYGGTSWSAPTWAGFCALINQARTNAGQQPLGLLGPKIYPLLGTGSFRDITTGNNGPNGVYNAGVGYDLCTGLGTPLVAALLQVLTTAPAGLFAISTLAGQAGSVGSTDGAGGVARFNTPRGVAVDGTGNVYVADTSNHTIRKITPAGAVSTLAGLAGTSGSTDATGGNARFNSPRGVAVDSTGNVYVADTANNTIRKITSTGAVTTLAGQAGASGSTNGTGSSARFNSPRSVAVDSAGNVYVADTSNDIIRMITPAGMVTTPAGRAGRTGTTNGTGSSARFNVPEGVTVDGAGNLYVADTGNHMIRKITPAAVVTTYAGVAGSKGSADGSSASAQFNSPRGVTVDSAGTVYVIDSGNHTIRMITPAGVVSTLAGLIGSSGSTDGIGSNARFNSPTGVTVDSADSLSVADTSNDTIRTGKIASAPQIQLQPQNQTVTAGQSAVFTVAAGGSPAPGYQWQWQAAGTTTWSNLSDNETYSGSSTATLTVNGTTVAMNGDQFQCVAGNGISPDALSNAATLTVNTVPVTTPPEITAQPADQTVEAGGSAIFTVAASGNPAPGYQWQRLPAGTATWSDLSDNQTYSGANTVTLTVSSTTAAMNSDQFRCVASNGISPNALSNAATLTVNTVPVTTPPEITAQPAGQTVTAGGSAMFTVAASGNPAPGYQWQRLPSGTATWSNLTDDQTTYSGTATATLTVSSTTAAMNGDQFRCVAGNGISPDALSNAVTLTVNTPPEITAQPAGQTVTAGGSAMFTVAASGNPAPGYQWQRLPAGAATWSNLADDQTTYAGATTATLTVSGTTAAMNGDQFRCVAGNGISPNALSNVATLTVNTPPAITSQPVSETVASGVNAVFTVAASGNPAPNYQWQRQAAGAATWSDLADNQTYAGASTATLTVSGTTAAMSGDQFRCRVSNGVGTAATSDTATLTVLIPFQQWQLANFSSDAINAGIADPLADPDDDGLPNLLEYAFGSDPLSPSASVVPVPSLIADPTDGQLHLALTANLNSKATDLTVSAEVSSDLVTWATGPDYTEVVSDTTVSGVRTLVIRDKTPLTPGATRFIRLSVSLSPAY